MNSPLYAEAPDSIRQNRNLAHAMPRGFETLEELEAMSQRELHLGRLVLVKSGDIRNAISDIKQDIPRRDFKRYARRVFRPLMHQAAILQQTADPENVHVIISHRAGQAFEEHINHFVPDATRGMVSQFRDEETQEVTSNFSKIGACTGKSVIIVDPMLATGNSVTAIIEEASHRGADTITTVHGFVAPQGAAAVLRQVSVNYLVCPEFEAGLNEHAFIVGTDGRMLGDFGDRYCGPSQ